MTEYKVIIDDQGTERWYLHDKRHRENDLPAVTWSDGTKFWYKDGKCHREDGPAVIYKDGDEFWYINDKRHREDGPAVIYASGDKKWYLNGKQLTEEEHRDLTRPARELPNEELAMRLQELLDKEATLANTGKAESKERAEVHTLIRIARDERYRPTCFGMDDCSTNMLVRCPWRMDCG